MQHYELFEVKERFVPKQGRYYNVKNLGFGNTFIVKFNHEPLYNTLVIELESRGYVITQKIFCASYTDTFYLIVTK